MFLFADPTTNNFCPHLSGSQLFICAHHSVANLHASHLVVLNSALPNVSVQDSRIMPCRVCVVACARPLNVCSAQRDTLLQLQLLVLVSFSSFCLYRPVFLMYGCFRLIYCTGAELLVDLRGALLLIYMFFFLLSLSFTC